MSVSWRGLWLALATVAAAGCDSLPYRVEWGFGQDEKEDGAAAPASSRAEAPAAAPLDRETAWLAWEELHDELVRIVSRRRWEAPAPKSAIARAIKSVDLLRPHHPAEQAALDRAQLRYGEIERTMRDVPTSWSLHELEQVARDLEQLR